MSLRLEELQSAFKNYLMSSDDAISKHIVSTKDLSNDLRLAIYSNAYKARLIEALEQDFEVLHVLLGDDEFAELASQYIETFPSRFYSLRWFGQYMAQYIADTIPYKNHPNLREMALFEWSFIEAFDSEDEASVTESDAAGIPAQSWPDLVIQLQSSLQCIEYQWNILPVWNAVHNDQTIPEFACQDYKSTCIVWRQGLKTLFRTLEPAEAFMLQHVIDGKSFAQLCERLLEQDPANTNVAMQAATILKTWITQGLVANLKY